MNKKYYSVKEVAKILGLAEQTIRGYLTSGHIKSEKFFYSTVISKEELNKHLKARGKKEIE